MRVTPCDRAIRCERESFEKFKLGTEECISIPLPLAPLITLYNRGFCERSGKRARKSLASPTGQSSPRASPLFASSTNIGKPM